MRVTWLPALVLLLAVALATPALATPACHASVTLVDFGRVDYEEGGDITGQLTVNCDGPTASRCRRRRAMAATRAAPCVGPHETVLRYNLYVDAARQRVWGDGESGGTARITGESDGRKAVGYTIYGRVPDRQSVRPGRYQRFGQGVGVALIGAPDAHRNARHAGIYKRFSIAPNGCFTAAG